MYGLVVCGRVVSRSLVCVVVVCGGVVCGDVFFGFGVWCCGLLAQKRVHGVTKRGEQFFRHFLIFFFEILTLIFGVVTV